ncbi:flavodoxin family protein [Streptacidiphilus rugosus]|uniref:flavodoxin family protein n=1 Tax=Streptacidiphilus rugosus TaxID=405783 RepID=UPI0005606AF6|nr:flavodoxin domain-containing protein [Streptacidiphilus rugosus]
MKYIAIVYESLFGNTRQIAETIRDELRASHPEAEVDCLRVDQADPEHLESVDLLVVGGPTHLYGMSSRVSRKMGVKAERAKIAQGETVREPEPGAQGPGVRTWLRALHTAQGRPRAAAFDTRTGMLTAGGAAHGIARGLRGHGYELIAPPMGFIVDGAADGPLQTGEIDRARSWAATLG